MKLNFQSKLVILESKKMPPSSTKKKKKNPLLFSHLCKWSSTYLASTEQTSKGEEVKVHFASIPFMRASWCLHIPWSTEDGRKERKAGGIQLNRMESGSLLAICAMCFSMSFFVMIPRSLLMTHTQRQNHASS